MSEKSYYLNNQQFTKDVEKQKPEVFHKYTDLVLKFMKSKGTYLDVGCATGIAIEQLNKCGVKASGVDISRPSIKVGQQKGRDCQWYDGERLPFKNMSFDGIGSFNVLEHTEDPEAFLEEQLRILKPGGYLFVVCPNFLSITNNFHHHTKGLLQKIKNLYGMFIRLTHGKVRFEKMTTIVRKIPKPDDSACNVTNPIDILKWAKANNLEQKFWSSQPIYNHGIANYLDTSFIRFFFGGSLIVLRKR